MAQTRLCLLLLALILVSCTSVRPVIKIGLLAPFEGLPRRSGYTALTAMRQAIADFAPAGVAIMPLAVDDTGDVAGMKRAVDKMLQDEAVRAIIGPYSLPLAQQLQPAMIATGLPWLMPLVIDPGQGFVIPDQAGEWAMPLWAAAAAAAQRQGCERLILAGWPTGWPALTDTQANNVFGLPVLVSDQLATIQSQDAIFWGGAPETGAAYFSALRTQFPNVPFFLGPQADSPIFAELTRITGPVYWLFWLDDGYEQWRIQSATPSPIAYLTYRATQQAIAASLGQSSSSNHSWRVAVAAVASDGIQ